MKKILISVQNAFKGDDNFEHQQKINSLMTILFKENETATSITIFEALRKSFEKEIARKGIEGLIEHTHCEEYFDRANTQIS
jgi:hypothetical protein